MRGLATTLVPISPGRALLLPGTSGRDRKPTRTEAARGTRGADAAQRRGFLELSARTAPGPHRPNPGEDGPDKCARRRSLRRPGGPQRRKRRGAEPPWEGSQDRDPKVLLEGGGAPGIDRP